MPTTLCIIIIKSKQVRRRLIKYNFQLFLYISFYSPSSASSSSSKYVFSKQFKWKYCCDIWYFSCCIFFSMLFRSRYIFPPTFGSSSNSNKDKFSMEWRRSLRLQWQGWAPQTAWNAVWLFTRQMMMADERLASNKLFLMLCSSFSFSLSFVWSGEMYGVFGISAKAREGKSTSCSILEYVRKRSGNKCSSRVIDDIRQYQLMSRLHRINWTTDNPLKRVNSLSEWQVE